MIDLVDVTLDHVRELARTMRAEDRAEVAKSLGATPYLALCRCLEASPCSWTLLIDGEVAAIFGVEEVEGRLPFLWLLSGEAVNRRPFPFLRICRAAIPLLLEVWPELRSAIDQDYRRAIQWAKWLGLELGEPGPAGIVGLPFVPVRLRAGKEAA